MHRRLLSIHGCQDAAGAMGHALPKMLLSHNTCAVGMAEPHRGQVLQLPLIKEQLFRIFPNIQDFQGLISVDN